MSYSDTDLNDYRNVLMLRGASGFFAEVNLTNNISVRPEIMFIGRGQKISDSDIGYKFRSNYIDFRLPVLYNFRMEPIAPYVMLSPYLGFATGGKIKLNDYSAKITKASIAPVDFGFLISGGAKKQITIAEMNFIASAEIAYNFGLINTFSKQERNETADALNMNLYTIEGTRKNRGISITASIAVPLRNFKRKKESQAIEEKIPKEDEIIKDCNTIEEINELLDAGKKVNNKVICMNNLNFEFNRSPLDEASKTYLNKIVSLLERAPSMSMKISGHTDNVGTDEYNMELSKKRAVAVYNYLISQGISKERLSYECHGATKPIASNDSDGNRAKNRRVEFKILK